MWTLLMLEWPRKGDRLRSRASLVRSIDPFYIAFHCLKPRLRVDVGPTHAPHDAWEWFKVVLHRCNMAKARPLPAALPPIRIKYQYLCILCG